MPAYRNKGVQSQLTEKIGVQIPEDIIPNVKISKYFVVLAGEATDRSLQLYLIITLSCW